MSAPAALPTPIHTSTLRIAACSAAEPGSCDKGHTPLQGYGPGGLAQNGRSQAETGRRPGRDACRYQQRFAAVDYLAVCTSCSTSFMPASWVFTRCISAINSVGFIGCGSNLAFFTSSMNFGSLPA